MTYRIDLTATTSTYPDQSYYWTPEWQEAEREAAEELAAGKGRTFKTPEEAIEWLETEEN